MIRFEWDSQKARLNLQKHGVSFDEALTVFYDNPHIFSDPDHSQASEDRLIAIGFSHRHRILMVVHCYREGDEVIRIISARKATKSERKAFEE
ncbi:MAG: BrnT family toxin [Flavobacteriales bacterium]